MINGGERGKKRLVTRLTFINSKVSIFSRRKTIKATCSCISMYLCICVECVALNRVMKKKKKSSTESHSESIALEYMILFDSSIFQFTVRCDARPTEGGSWAEFCFRCQKHFGSAR